MANAFIKNYDSYVDLVADVSNLEDKQVVSCTQTLTLYRKNPTTHDLELLVSGGGSPLGSIIAFYGSTAPAGYLVCDGSTFVATDYPALYALLGTNVLPDLRETTLVGIGENDTDSIEAHDVYTLGEFKDDQLQTHTHTYIEANAWYEAVKGGSEGYRYNTGKQNLDTSDPSGRTGTTTHGKQKGVLYCIRAVSGVENEEATNLIATLETYIRNQEVLSDYETASSSFTAEYDGFISAKRAGTGESVYIRINDVTVALNSNAQYGSNAVSVLFKKGDAVVTNDSAPYVCYYKLRDYSGR